MAKRKLLLLGAIVLTSAALGVPSATATPCSPPNGSIALTWMRQYVSTTTDGYYSQKPGTCVVNNPYFGWIGIDGRVTTPSTVTPLTDYTSQHDLGHLAMVFPSNCMPRCVQVQVGYYVGQVGLLTNEQCAYPKCTRRNGSWGTYVELYDVHDDFYRALDFGSLANGSAVTYRIQYNSSEDDGLYRAWDVYNNYNHKLFIYYTYNHASGEPYAARELANISPTIPTGDFGYTSGGTNATLRIYGAHGYEDWDQSLTAYSTSASDFLNEVPQYLYVFGTRYFHFSTVAG